MRWLFFGLLTALVLKAQLPLAPVRVALPSPLTHVQLTALPSRCQTMTLSLIGSDLLQPSMSVLTRAVGLFALSETEAEYRVEFSPGLPAAIQIYLPGQLQVYCPALATSWENKTVLKFTQPETRLDLKRDFQPLSGAVRSEGTGHQALFQQSASCRRPADSRFFDVQGQDYRLSLNAGPAVTVIGRRSWGAGPVLAEGRSWKKHPDQASVCTWFRRITVHHTHTSFSMLQLQQFHQQQADPKADIGYHFYISAEGGIYEARPLGYMGSHSEADNSMNLGIVLNGDFSQQLPDPRQLASLKALLAALRCPCGFAEGVWTHQQRKHVTFSGDPAHATLCPGAAFAPQVYELALELGYGPLTLHSP